MSEQFSRSVMRLTMAQIIFGEGIEDIEGHAFDLLVDVVSKYIETVGKRARTLAEVGRRTECELEDFERAFQELRPNQVNMEDLVKMCEDPNCQIPYTVGVPEFPVERRKRRKAYGQEDKSFHSEHEGTESAEWNQVKMERLGEQILQGKDREHPDYVPSHFPPFPEKYTYSKTQVDATSRETDPKVILERNLEEQRRVQQALAKIHNSSRITPPETFGAMDIDEDPSQSMSSADDPAESQPSQQLPSAFQ